MLTKEKLDSDANTFYLISEIGRKLADLHLNYETCEKYPLKPKAKFGKLEKMSFLKQSGKQDKTKLKINGIHVFDLPEIKYHVNGRTPIELIVDKYKRTVDKDSGIVNDPTEHMTEQKTIDMIQRLTYVGIESDKLIALLSELPFEPENYKHTKTNLDEWVDE